MFVQFHDRSLRDKGLFYLGFSITQTSSVSYGNFQLLLVEKTPHVKTSEYSHVGKVKKNEDFPFRSLLACCKWVFFSIVSVYCLIYIV